MTSRRSFARLCLGAAATVTTAAAARSAAADTPVTVITYNVGDISADDLRADLRELKALGPQVIGLQEVADRDEILKGWAANQGYKVLYEEVGQASKHNAFLLPQGVEVADRGAIRMHGEEPVNPNTPGSASGVAPPKYINWVRFRTGGRAFVVGNVHFIPSAGQYDLNRELFRKEAAACADWFSTRDFPPLLLGDFNAEPDFAPLAPLRDVARPWTEMSHPRTDRAIDIVWSRRAVTGSVNARNGFHSDHKPVVLRASMP